MYLARKGKTPSGFNKTYLGIAPDGTRVVFENAVEFASQHPPLAACCIRDCARGTQKNIEDGHSLIVPHSQLIIQRFL
jgi:hypothetical protein